MTERVQRLNISLIGLCATGLPTHSPPWILAEEAKRWARAQPSVSSRSHRLRSFASHAKEQRPFKPTVAALGQSATHHSRSFPGAGFGRSRRGAKRFSTLAPVQKPSNSPRCIHRRLVLPDPYDLPSGSFQLGVVQSVPLDVSTDLGAPIVGIGPRARSVVRASVPEAAINKDGQLLTTEDDVRSAAQGCDRPRVDPISESATMKLGADSQLGTSVALAISPHSRAHCGRRRFGCFRNGDNGSLGSHSIGGRF
jgi:hypothetical protein